MTGFKSLIEGAIMAESQRCDPLRQQLSVIQAEITQIQSNLTDAPDLPPQITRNLRELLGKLEGLQPEVQRVLQLCEAIP
jgi:hypothetical protein